MAPSNALAGISWRDSCAPKQLTCPTDVLLCFLSFTSISSPLSVSLSLPLSRLKTPSLLSLLSLPPCAHAHEHNIRDNLTHSADSCAGFQRVENVKQFDGYSSRQTFVRRVPSDCVKRSVNNLPRACTRWRDRNTTLPMQRTMFDTAISV
jgi:hypothetical protein